jgi:hypothetical protein
LPDSFCGCLSHLQGGCIYAGEVASFTVVDCNFTANGALPSAADAWTANGAAIATDGTRTSNVYPVNLVVRKSTFMKNTADVGGAIMAVQYASGSGRVEVHDCLFSRNTVSAGDEHVVAASPRMLSAESSY